MLLCFSKSGSHYTVSHRNGSGVFISDVVKGGAADVDGRLMQGDQILSVDGEDMRRASQETVAAILKVLKPPLTITTQMTHCNQTGLQEI